MNLTSNYYTTQREFVCGAERLKCVSRESVFDTRVWHANTLVLYDKRSDSEATSFSGIIH